MINDGYLCDLTIKTIRTDVNLGKIATQNGDYNLKELAARVDTPIRNKVVVATYLDQLQSHTIKSTLVFAVNVQHIQNLVQEFIDNGILAVGIHGNTPQDQREQILIDFKEKRIPVLINCGIITEGVDIPNIDCLLMARPTKSGVLLQQMLGRGMRLHEGKEYCLVLDFVDTIDSNMMRATIPTLLGLNPDCIMNEVVSNLESNTSLPDPSGYELDEVTISVIPFGNPFSVRSLESDSNFIRKYSKLAWVRVGPEKWVIFVYLKNETIYMEQKENKLFYGYSRTSHGHYKSAPKEILRHDSFASAVQGLDQYIVDKIGYFGAQSLSWAASWRYLDMTPGQQKLLSQSGIKGDFNRGTAADLITKYRFGAKQEFSKQRQMEKLKQKQELEKQKLMVV
ncbi:hypothetical protein HK103_005087 [Boothiomyces macroporosus]|uniref:Helicase C-terminal domain-containing protein n=1 Tax=Boothiomyces macroporosus TaxID=261099 RepID=A0AAD5Y5E7_9FUNG|nr:hypothetical protein HK103_005087 [Boothiomyces macroporosus]